MGGTIGFEGELTASELVTLSLGSMRHNGSQTRFLSFGIDLIGEGVSELLPRLPVQLSSLSTEWLIAEDRRLKVIDRLFE